MDMLTSCALLPSIAFITTTGGAMDSQQRLLPQAAAVRRVRVALELSSWEEED